MTAKSVASLQLLSRVKVNECVDDRRRIDQLCLPRILKKWLNECYVMDNDDKLLARKFNARARSKKLNLKMIPRSKKNWHLETCSSLQNCTCTDLLNDPGRIFDDTPSHISPDERDWYFDMLAFKNGKEYCAARGDIHFSSCSEVFECACSMVTKNPEHFFNVPLEDRFQLPTLTEIQELREEWMEKEMFNFDVMKLTKTDCLEEWLDNKKEKIKKFNIVCRVLGKALKFVETELDGYHLNNCWDGHYYNCEEILDNPKEFFIYTHYFMSSHDKKYTIIGEKNIHVKECPRVQILCDPYKKFPESFECTCMHLHVYAYM